MLDTGILLLYHSLVELGVRSLETVVGSLEMSRELVGDTSQLLRGLVTTVVDVLDL